MIICYPRTANDSLDLSGWSSFLIESPITSHHPLIPLALGRTIIHQDEAVEVWWSPNQLEGNACPELHVGDILSRSEKALDKHFFRRDPDTQMVQEKTGGPKTGVPL